MLSYQAREYYEFISKEFEIFNNKMLPLFEFKSKFYDENFIICFQKDLEKNANTEVQQLKSKFINLVNNLKSKFSCMQFSRSYGDFKKKIFDYIETNNIKDDTVSSFFNKVDIFNALYEKFLQSNNSIKIAFDFYKVIDEIQKNLVILVKVYRTFSNNLLDIDLTDINKEESEVLNIQLLEVEYDTVEFANKLLLINEIYEDIGNIIYKKKNYKKIKIVKIESGSLLDKILGDKNIIKSFALLLENSVKLIFNKYTFEGKLGRQIGLKELIESNAEVSQKFKEEYGLDMSEADEDIQKAFTRMNKNILKLTEDSTKIKINDTIYEPEEDKNKYLEERKKLMLNSGKEIQESKNKKK